jgi:hypothetical protein
VVAAKLQYDRVVAHGFGDFRALRADPIRNGCALRGRLRSRMVAPIFRRDLSALPASPV